MKIKKVFNCFNFVKACFLECGMSCRQLCILSVGAEREVLRDWSMMSWNTLVYFSFCLDNLSIGNGGLFKSPLLLCWSQFVPFYPVVL